MSGSTPRRVVDESRPRSTEPAVEAIRRVFAEVHEQPDREWTIDDYRRIARERLWSHVALLLKEGSTTLEALDAVAVALNAGRVVPGPMGVHSERFEPDSKLAPDVKDILEAVLAELQRLATDLRKQ